MRLFRKRNATVEMPDEAKRIRQETHAAAEDATRKLKRLNKVMANGVTLKIYHAMGGEHER